MTQEHSSELLLTASGIQHRVPRRTVAPHPARAFTNAPRGTRPLRPSFLHVDLPMTVGADLHVTNDPHLRRGHQPDRPALAFLVPQRAGEDPVAITIRR